MGIGEKLRDIYYTGEEKWYSFWDKVDSKIPIYKIIDPIDGIVPSFALFLILIFILLLLVATSMMGFVNSNQLGVNIQVIDSYGSPIEGASIEIKGINEKLFTNEYGLTKEINLNLGQYNITATKEDKTKTDLIFVDEAKTIQITLQANSAIFSSKSIIFRTENGDLATGELALSFACSSGISEGVPSDQTIYGGTTNIAQPESCGTLTVSVSSPKYTTETFTLSGPSGNFTLKEKEPKTQVKIVVNLKENNELITEGISVQAFSLGQVYSPIEVEQAINGQAQFDLIEGDYIFKTSSEKGYKATTSQNISLTKEAGQKTITLNLEKQYLGKVRAIIKEGSSLLSGVRVALTKQNSLGSLQEIWAYESDSNGVVEFDVTEEGPFTLIATKENYCDKSIEADIGEEVTLNLKKYDGTCGHELKVKVIDSDGKPVQFAKVVLFSETIDDSQKLSYQEKITDFNGVAKWNPVRKNNNGEKYKVLAFKSTYSGWSEAKELNATTSSEEFLVTLEIPQGIVKIIAKDLDGDALQFAEVQLFDEYGAGAVSGKRIIENIDGSIELNIKADKMVYAVIKKEGYESYTTLPKQIIGNGTITLEAKLSRPPIEELVVRPLGFYKNGQRAQKVEANQEYDALFEITAPKEYDELGFFVRVGKDYTTKTEMDKIFIKNIYSGGLKTTLMGGTYNKPSGYSTDEEYLNLEENKWAQIKWIEEGFVPGKIIVGVKVKIRQTALQEERIDLGYRAWGVIDGDYERDPFDNELGTSENKSGKQALYALTKPDYITVGIETLCDATTEDRSFCITSTYTDQDGFTHSFNDSFDALNNTPYTVSINVMNNSLMGFDNAKIMLDNTEENIMLNSYIIKTPRNETKNAELNTFQTEWIDVSGFDKGLSIDIMDLKITPQKTGSGSLLLRIREQNELIFEKTFTINISSDKKMNLTYLNDGEFKNEVPKIISGKFQLLTIKAKNAANNLEIENAIVKVFDRFGTKIFNTNTNALGVAIIEIPASFPGEKLKIKVEKPEYETLEKEIEIAKDVVTITPTELNFTVNPQTNKSDSKTVKITNQTGLDLTIKEIKLGGKLKGVLSESQIESWFDQYIGKKILSQDYEEIEFKVISSDYVKIATDLEAIFQVTLSAEGKTWTQEVNAKIRVGLGKDVDNQSCLQITPTSWNTQTRGNTIELGAELVNNCTVDSKPVQLKNLGLKLDSKGSIAGDFVGIYKTAQVEISPAYSKTLKPTITPGERIPLLLRFTPLAGTGGTATGTIIFEAENNTDSSPQKITTGIEFNIEYENLQDCLSLGTGLVTIDEGQSGTFAVINNCKFNSDIQIDNGDLQAALSDKTFTLKAGESKEIQVTAQLGQMPGAYNMLVHARQPGTNFELLDNVKIIVNPINSCFTLTRYEYDVYDSEFNNFDGIDRGYLKNSCVQKTVSANVTGIVPFDNWQSILTSALIGGIAGAARSGKFAPDWISALWSDDTKNNSEKIANSKAELQSRLSKDAIDSTKSAQGVGKQVDSRIKEQDLKLDKIISDVDKAKEMLKKYYDSEKKCAAEYTASMAKLDAIKKEALANRAKLKTDTTSLEKRLDSIIEDIKKNQENASRKVQEKSIQLKEKVDKGEMGAELAAFEFSILSDDLINEGSENSSSREKEYAELAKELQKIVAESEKGLEKNRKELFDSVVDCSNCFKEEGIVDTLEGGEEERYSEECQTRYKDTLKEEDVVKYVLNDYDCSGNAWKEFFEGTDPNKGYCCFNSEGPTSMCKTAFGSNQESIVISEKENCNSYDGRVEVKINEFDSKYKCCRIATAADLVELEKEEPAQVLKKTGVVIADKIAEITFMLDATVPWYYSGAVTDDSKSNVKTQASVSTESYNLSPMAFRFIGLFDGMMHATNMDLIDKQEDACIKDIIKKGPQEVSWFRVIEYYNVNSNKSYCVISYNKNKISGGAKISRVANAFVKPVTYQRESECNSLMSELKDYFADKKNSFSNSIPYTYCKRDLKKTGSIVKLDCNGTEIYEVRSKSKRVLGFVENESNGQKMLDSYNNFPKIKSTYGDSKNVNIPPLNSVENVVEVESSSLSATAQFLAGSNVPGLNTANSTTSIQDVMGNSLFNVVTSAGVGMFGGSFLGGAAASALLALMQATDTEINYAESFFVPQVVITGFELESGDGVSVNTFDNNLKIYEYAKGEGVVASSPSNSEVSSQAGLNSSYAGTVLYDPQTLTATVGLEELIELEFTNSGKKVNRSPNEPFVGLLTVTGQEAVYESDYEYDYVKGLAQKDGQDLDVDREGIFGTVLDFIGGPGLKRELTAQMKADYLKVKEVRPYKKEFHLLFDSYEYVDCGPNTYPCTARELSNCDVDGKSGYTGVEGLPRMKLAWNWSDIGVNECDSDANPDEYNYCDSTQFSIMLLRRLIDLKEFFNSTNLTACPSSAEIAGTKTQDLADNDLDVAITSVEVESLSTGALVKTTVQTNNNLEMSAKLSYVIKRNGEEEEISGVCEEQTQTFTSSIEYVCEIDKSITGEGSFNVDIVMTPTLCSGCGNRVTGNDSIRTTVIIGASGASQCLKYSTTRDYFEKVLAANNQLNTAQGQKALSYISFKANLLRDGFSNDFKADFDEFINSLANAPVEYNTGGFRELFLSDKLVVKWPEKPGAWSEGKYDATIVINFKNDSWRWDNNNIESIEVNFSPQGPPEIPFSIYKVAFNGIVGLESDNGRQGYGAGYEQLTEDLFLVTNNSGTRVYARPNASNNPATIVKVSMIKGTQAFNLLNSIPTRGNVLSIYGNDVIEFVLTPSVAVPLILNVTRDSSTDAYAFYSAEVNGQPQNTGGSFISWTGIGQGCVDFEGKSMTSYFNTYDTLASGSFIGFSGYGLPAWTLAQRSGTASFFGTFFAPQDATTILKITGANESAMFESTMGNGSTIAVNPTNSSTIIETLSDVLELVKQEKICVIGGDYYWNNNGLREELKSTIDAKENTCIPNKGS